MFAAAKIADGVVKLKVVGVVNRTDESVGAAVAFRWYHMVRAPEGESIIEMSGVHSSAHEERALHM